MNSNGQELGEERVESLPGRSGLVVAGDVLSYVPERHHCREGIAFVRENGRIADTFWGPMDGEAHHLTAGELSTATVLFNVNEYEPLGKYTSGARMRWLTYHPDDRGRIPSRHGLQEELFVRRGAEPDLATRIDNAAEAVEEAERDMRSAQLRLDLRRSELALLREETPTPNRHAGDATAVSPPFSTKERSGSGSAPKEER